MKNLSMRGKMLSIIFLTITVTVAIILFVTNISINLISTHDANLVMEHIARENANKIDKELDGLEHSVDSVYFYAIDQLMDGTDKLWEENYRKDYLAKVEEIALSEARNTNSVKVVYFRLTTDITEGEKGFLYSSDKISGRFEKQTLTEIEQYKENDIEHVGWYYLPKNAEQALWIGPYYNKNLGIRMMSYVVPVYINHTFIGVIGMDIDVSMICSELAQIRVYETGSTVLFDAEDNIVYHKDYPQGLDHVEFTEVDTRMLGAMQQALKEKSTVEFKAQDGMQKIYATRIQNGMTLCIQVLVNEINATQHTVLLLTVVISVVILIINLLLAVLVLNRFLQPLQELTEASKQLADGKLDVSISYRDNDEVGQLAATFEMMAQSLKKYFDYFHSLAYTDSLTGLNNKAAYQITRDVIESEIRMGRAMFSIIIMDVNNLKTINDTLGHDVGDMLLKHVTRCMRETFVGYPLYRIGGDEFCSIINGTEVQSLIIRLQTITAEKSTEDKELFGCDYQIAAGAAIYDREQDKTFEDVFRRADTAMYENKRFLKEENKNNNKK